MTAERAASPIVIYGAPRSGTTYLNAILNEHPDVFITQEMRLFAWLHQVVNVLPRKERFIRTYQEQFIRHLNDKAPQLIRDFYAQMWPHARHWGDKNPHYADVRNKGSLQTISALFPGAWFIHIIRDGRDVVTSLLRKRRPDGTAWVEFQMAHRVWKKHVSNGVNFGRSLPPAQYFELRYEDLVRDDLGCAQKIFDFLQIPIHQKVISFCQDQQSRRTPFSGPTRDLASGPGGSDWSNVLTPAEQARSLEMIGAGLVRLGYVTKGSLKEMKSALTAKAP